VRRERGSASEVAMGGMSRTGQGRLAPGGAPCKHGAETEELVREPLRTNITPDQRLGSPGVRLTKTPCGHACLRPALRGRVVQRLAKSVRGWAGGPGG
jgi:hypothetical protein